jgi:flagellar assembly protein FliH
MTKKRSTGRIPAGDLPSIKAWKLPVVDGAHIVRSPFNEKEGKDRPQGHVVEDELELKPLTVQEIEKIRQDAYDEGFSQGRAEGFKEGRKAGETQGYQEGLRRAEGQAKAEHARLAVLMKGLQEPLALQRDELEAALLRLTIDMAFAVLKQEVSTHPDTILQALHDALESLPRQQGPISIQVSPQDEAVVSKARQTMGEDWLVKPDSQIQPGGCKIKSSFSYLDYSLENRFRQVAEQLLEQYSSRHESE